MYEDPSWYSFVPDLTGRKAEATPTRSSHKRKESLLQQPNVRASSGREDGRS